MLDSSLLLLTLQHLFSLRLELSSRSPFGILICVVDVIADNRQQPEIFDSALEIPVGLYLIRMFVVIVRGVVLLLLKSPTGRLADVVYSGVRVESRHSLLCKAEMIRAVKGPDFRPRVRPERSAPLLCGLP